MNFEEILVQIEPPDSEENVTLSPYIKVTDLKMNDTMMILNGVVYEEVTDESVLCVPVSDTLFGCNIDSELADQQVDPDDFLDEHNYTHNIDNVKLNMFFANIINTKASSKLLECTLCQKIMKTPGAFYRHVRTHTGEKPYQCELCNKKFSQQSNLWKHVLIHTGERRYKCPSCNKKFSQRANMQKHMMVHTGEKPFSCYICSRTFTQRANLNKHIRIHTGEKPYTCKYCNRQFAQQSNMQKHELLHQGIKPFTCTICNAAFTQQSNLKKHIATHVIGNRIRLNKIHECDICNKKFDTKNSLCKHFEKCIINHREEETVTASQNMYIDVCTNGVIENNDRFLSEFSYACNAVCSQQNKPEESHVNNSSSNLDEIYNCGECKQKLDTNSILHKNIHNSFVDYKAAKITTSTPEEVRINLSSNKNIRNNENQFLDHFS